MSASEPHSPPPAAAPEAAPSGLHAPVTTVWGVGVDRARLLARLDIFTIEDLLLHRPRRYEDRRAFLSIRALKLKEPATVRGKSSPRESSDSKKGPAPCLNAFSMMTPLTSIAAGGRPSRG